MHLLDAWDAAASRHMTKARQGTDRGTARMRVKGTVRTVLLSLRLLLRAFQRKKELKFVETFTFFNLYEEQFKLLRREE